MKHALCFTQTLLAAALSLGLGACSNDDLSTDKQMPTDGKMHLKMHLLGSLTGYDQGQGRQTRAASSTSTWNEGDKIYIKFTQGSNTIPGVATYTSGAWNIDVDGQLTAGTNLKCTAHHFINATYAENYRVELNHHTEIYEDTVGVYNYANGDLTVEANLVPKVSRIRFTGEKGKVAHIMGISHYKSFSPTNGDFTATSVAVSDTLVADTASTDENAGTIPYIYGYFTDKSRTLSVAYDELAYTRNCSSSVLKAGESGYMSLPTEASHPGWRNGFTLRVNGVDYKMLPVPGYSGGYFLMGETELTEEFYQHVTYASSTSTSQAATTWLYDNGRGANNFVSKIAALTGLQLSLPDREQWKFAAKGGLKTHGYTYAGSNVADDVAWYSSNSGNNSNRVVKLKAPNELGLYDMSGNVGEWTNECVNTSSSYYYYCGGGCVDDLSKITVNSILSGYNSAEIGVRLILTFPQPATGDNEEE